MVGFVTRFARGPTIPLRNLAMHWTFLQVKELLHIITVLQWMYFRCIVDVDVWACVGDVLEIYCWCLEMYLKCIVCVWDVSEMYCVCLGMYWRCIGSVLDRVHYHI